MDGDIKMLRETEIKKYSAAYNLLQDLKEYELAKLIELKMRVKGYVVEVVRDKYKFKWVKKE